MDVLRTTMSSFGILKGNFLKAIRNYLSYVPMAFRSTVVSGQEGWDKTNRSVPVLGTSRYRTTLRQQYFMRKISGSALTLGLLDAVAAKYTAGAGLSYAEAAAARPGSSIYNRKYNSLVVHNLHSRVNIFKV